MDIICPRCNSLLKEPKGLMCNHPMCSRCLQSYVQNEFSIQNEQCGVSCPVCQAFTAIPNPNKPITHWSDDFPLLEDVANEINELKLITKAVVPALRHNMNVWIQRNIQPVPLFTLTKANQDYTFNTTWPNTIIDHDLFQREMQPHFRLLHRRPGNVIPYQQTNNISALSIFSSVIPKIKYLIASTEIGAKAITAGNELYENFLSKTRSEVGSGSEPSAVMASCEESMDIQAASSALNQTLPSSDQTSLKTDAKPVEAPVAICGTPPVRNKTHPDDEPMAIGGTSVKMETKPVDKPMVIGGTPVVRNDATVLDEPVKSNSEYFGRAMSYEQTVEQKHTEQFHTRTSQDGEPQYVKVENTYNYYTTNIYMTSKQDSALPNPLTTTLPNPSVAQQTSPEKLPSAVVGSVAANDNSKETENLINANLFHSLQGPKWAIPSRQTQAIPGPNGAEVGGCSIMKNEWMEKMLSSFNHQLERFKTAMNSCKNVNTDSPQISKRGETFRKNKQDRKKFGPNFRLHTSKGRRFNTSRSLAGKSSNVWYDSTLFDFTLMKYDKNPREK